MRIISKFKDFYDQASSYGIDLGCIYIRDTKWIDIDLNVDAKWRSKDPLYFHDDEFIRINNLRFYKLYLGIAEMFYPIIKISKFNFEVLYFYNFDSLKKHLVKEKINIQEYKEKEKEIKNFFKFNSDQRLVNIFFQQHTPVFLYSGYNRSNKKISIQINPCLKDLNFQTQQHPAELFQSIFQYLAGVLGNKEKDIIEIDDKYKVKAHGFDIKYGFRKRPKNDKK